MATATHFYNAAQGAFGFAQGSFGAAKSAIGSAARYGSMAIANAPLSTLAVGTVAAYNVYPELLPDVLYDTMAKTIPLIRSTFESVENIASATESLTRGVKNLSEATDMLSGQVAIFTEAFKQHGGSELIALTVVITITSLAIHHISRALVPRNNLSPLNIHS